MIEKKSNLIVAKRQQSIRRLPIEFVFLTLPYKEVEANVYEKESDNSILSITSGYSSSEKKYYGIPYGIYPRMILYFICNEVKRTQSKEIYLGKNVQDVLERMALTNTGIRNDGSVLKSFKEQLLRLTSAVITVTSKKNFKDLDDTRLKENSVKIVKSIEFWKKNYTVDYKLVLTDDFYNYLTSSSMTLFDTELLHHIKSSPVTLDLYVLLNYKAYIAYCYQKDIFISFSELYNYFGTKNSFRSFKQNIKKKIYDLLLVYKALNINIQEDKEKNGVVVRKDSMPTVQPDLFSSNYL